MNYEMALKLKKAGFPRVGSVEISINNGVEEELWFPTLSDLIESCGIMFDMLYYRPTGSAMHDKKGAWFSRRTFPLTFTGIKNPDSRGSTPEEAVANLWLKLNAPKPSLNS